MFQVELVWNRKFDFVPYSHPRETVKEAIKVAQDIENSGDGARVKKTRVTNEDDKVIWAHGKLVIA